MFVRLARRLTAWYVFVSVTVLLVVVGVCTLLAFSMFAHETNDSISVVALQASQLERLYDPRHTRIDQVGPAVIKALQRPGLRVFAVNDRGYRSPPRPEPRAQTRARDAAAPVSSGPASSSHRGQRHARGDGHDTPLGRFIFGLGALIGLRPQRVPFLDGAIIIVPDSDALTTIFATYFAAIVPLGILAGILAWLAGRYITSQALRPLYEVTDALEAFAAGDFTPRAIPPARSNDFGALAHAYNGAAQQVSAAFAEREAAETRMRQFVADAGHELRTPLTVVVGFIDVLRRRITPTESTQKIFRTIALESDRMRTLIDNLILLARMERPPQNDPVAVDLASLAEHVVETRRAIAPSNTIEYGGIATAVVSGDEFELHEAVENLVDNAIKYAPGAPITVRIAEHGDRFTLTVADGGPGMTSEEVAHAFDRFYRGDARGEVEGSGLGLAIVKRAVERARGTVRLESHPGGRTIFTIELPRLEAPVRTSRFPQPPPRSPTDENPSQSLVDPGVSAH